MTPLEIEGEAELMLRQCSADDAEPPAILLLAKRVLGTAVEAVHARALPGDGALATVNGCRRIYVRSGLSAVRLRWAVAHELGHLVLGLDSSCRENEDSCDAFAAAILAPRRAFTMALRDAGPSFGKLARRLQSTESLVALRLGELTGCPLALLTPERVRVRGGEFVWSEDVLSSRVKSGVRRTTLRDDPRRVVLRIA